MNKMKSKKYQISIMDLKCLIQQHILSSLFLKQSMLNVLVTEFFCFVFSFIYHNFVILCNFLQNVIAFYFRGVLEERNRDREVWECFKKFSREERIWKIEELLKDFKI